MYNKRKKYFKIIILLILLFFTFTILNKSKEKVVFMYVGQGNSSLIYTKDRVVLIDGGPDWSVLSEISKVLKQQRKINDIIITHFHSDHYFGLMEIIRRYKVENIYYNSYSKQLLSQPGLLDSLKKEEINLIPAQRGDKVNLRALCKLYFLWPKAISIDKFTENERSFVNYFSCGKVKILFTGDISKAVEKQLISLDKTLKFNVLQAAHHGSDDGNSWEFLEFYQPKKIIISAGKANKYGLPSEYLLSRARKLNIEVIDLSKQGSYEILLK